MKDIFNRWLNSKITKDIFLKYEIDSDEFKYEFESEFEKLFNKLDSEVTIKMVDYFEDKLISLKDLLTILENLKYSFEATNATIIERNFFKLLNLIVSKFNLDEIMQNRLIKSNNLLNEYKKVVDISNIVSKTDLKGNITYVNSKFCEISGYSKKELIGKPHNLLRHPNMPKEAFENLWETIQAKKIWQGVVQNLKRDGSSYFVDSTIMPIFNEDGKVIEYIAIRHDVTQLVLKTAEVEELKLKQMVENIGKAIDITIEDTIKNMPIATIVIDMNDNILNYNEEFESIFDMLEDRKILSKLHHKNLNLRNIFIANKEFLTKDELINWKDEFSEKIVKLNDKKKVMLKLKKIESEEKRYIINLIFKDF